MTEQEAREMRLDRLEFKTLEDAIQFGESNHLQTRNIYKYSEDCYKICRFTKSGKEMIGRFINGNYIPGCFKVVSHKKMDPNRKEVDGQKFKRYLEINSINKRDLCASIRRSPAFIQDIIRRGNVDILAWEKICDILDVDEDFFNIEEPEPEVIPEEEKVEDSVKIDETDHDILVSLLISQKKIEALLMEIVSLLK